MPPDDLCYWTIHDLASRIRAKEISPVEVTRAQLERIDSLDKTLNAYITVLPDQALQEARKAEQEIVRGDYRGPFHGVPIAVKDLFESGGMKTTAGSLLLKDYVPAQDATALARLRQQGAILLGKLNLHEFAYGGTGVNPHYGTSKNPWSLDRVPGGSSSGSGVAVAAGIAFGSLGTDTGGSVRLPAAFCGIVGLKPTYGRCSRAGIIPLAWSLDHPGPMVRSVGDAALMLNVIAGHDPRDPATAPRPVPDYTHGLAGDLQGVRIGLPRPVFLDDLDPEVEAAVKGAMRDLESLGARIEIIPLPKMRHAQFISAIIIAAEAAAYHLESLRMRAHQFGPDVCARLKLGTLLPAWAYLKAQRMREAIRREMVAAMAQVDVLLTPTVAVEAPTIEQCTVKSGDPLPPVLTQVARLTRPFNLTGSPVISIPCGFTFSGLPIGMQIVGKPFDEAMVLRVAHAYEQATEWHSRRPNW
ncbi:MAG: Asp-tRNA(Asn)/Glu-tRNA(Gln) amidotransferase subunit GatA [Nitrospinae bacterium]|nr:Asp-tRNA(Asn)/Glu-tRNA(Gln) amidotransferase subunit GatA [Nitrospinota bacterium]